MAILLLVLNVAVAFGHSQFRNGWQSRRHHEARGQDSAAESSVLMAKPGVGLVNATDIDESSAYRLKRDEALQEKLTAYFRTRGLSKLASDDVVLERSFRYLRCPCMSQRQARVAELFGRANCTAVYEVGGMWQPLSQFLGRDRGLSYVNIDPTAEPLVSAAGGVRAVHLPMLLAEFAAEPGLRSAFGLPDLEGACVAALGIFTPHLRSGPDERALLALTRGARLVALEAAISETGCREALPVLERASALLEGQGLALLEERSFDCTSDGCVRRLLRANGYRRLRVFGRGARVPGVQ